MGYKTKPSKGFGGFGRSYRSGYLQNRDPLSHYRQFSQPESEYDRKLKSSVLRSEISGPSKLSDSDPSYREFLARQYVEHKTDVRDFDDLTENILKKAIDEFRKETSLSEMPQEMYEVEKESAELKASRFEEMKEHPEYFYSTPTEFQNQDKTIDRFSHPSEKISIDSTDVISDIAAYDTITNQNFQRKRNLGHDSEVDAM
ncbi:MAG TPA: hypothetical protein VJ771_06570 [Candidatus Nitrosotalea sp.]|nr:hypothetical protein [Candidatus Nitrosotalea sp.]